GEIPTPFSLDRSSSQSVFKPSVLVVPTKKYQYDVIVDTLAPNSGFVEDKWEMGAPKGHAIDIPETAHLRCNLKPIGGEGRESSMYLKSLRWTCHDVKVGEGKSQLAVHVVLADAVVGTTVVQLPAGGRIALSSTVIWPADLLPWPLRKIEIS